MGITLKNGLLGLVAISLAGLASMDATANALRNRAPKVVSLFPGETQAQIVAMNDSFLMRQKAPPREKTFPAAKRALRAEPLNAAALRLMAFSADPTGKSSEAVKFATLADKVTRRDFFAQLIMIDASARSGNTRQALEHYDAALRVHPGSRQAVYPILKAALVSQAIRQDLSRYIVARSNWTQEFISYASLDPKSVSLVADVVLRAGKGMHREDLVIVGPPLLTRLLQSRQYANAVRLLSLLPGGDARVLTSADWTAISTGPDVGMAAWMLNGTATSSANFLDNPDDGKRSLSLYAGSGAHDIIAAKILFLTPGYYTLSQRTMAAAPPDQGQAVTWRLVCVTTQETPLLWSSENILALPEKLRLGGIRIPSDCRQQRLDLLVEIDFDASALDLAINDFHFTRSSAPAQTAGN